MINVSRHTPTLYFVAVRQMVVAGNYIKIPVDAFCEKYVEKKIIQGKKIKLMNDLFKVFVKWFVM